MDVGKSVGDELGYVVGLSDGINDGWRVGFVLGMSDTDGAELGAAEGCNVHVPHSKLQLHGHLFIR